MKNCKKGKMLKNAQNAIDHNTTKCLEKLQAIDNATMQHCDMATMQQCDIATMRQCNK